jgi:hypothetical protein
MCARLCILKGSSDRIDKGLSYLREEVLFSLVDFQSSMGRWPSVTARIHGARHGVRG